MGNISFAIIIVTYNGMQWLDKCLESCKDYHVIIVDNGSNDTTIEFIKEHYKDVTVLSQSKNLGFGAANNIGIRYALDHGAEHVFLLNQDAYLVDDALAKLVAFQKENNTYGIVSPIHINAKKNKLDAGFANYISFGNTPYFVSDAVLQNNMQPVYEVPFVNAAAWLISKACLETVGGFDPLFFHYGEDDNYCQRVLYHGFKIGVVPTIFVVHDREGRSHKIIEPNSTAYFEHKEKQFKVTLANVNDTAYKTAYNFQSKVLIKACVKALLQFRFYRFKGCITELNRFRKLEGAIDRSQTTNKTKGLHYL